MGATPLLAHAIQAEVAAYLDARSDVRDEAGRQPVVRNGYLPQRTILTGVAPVEVKQPRVQDRRPSQQRLTCLTMVFKWMESASKTGRLSNGSALLPKPIAGVQFVDGVEQTDAG